MPTTHESTRALYYYGQTVPQLNNLVITEEHIRQAKIRDISVGQLLEIVPMSPLREEEIKRKYVRGQPLVKPEEVKNLPMRMYELHDWYTKLPRVPIKSPSW